MSLIDWRHLDAAHPQRAIQAASTDDLLALLSARRTSNAIKIWQAYALEEVVRRYGIAEPAPLQEGAVLSLAGNTSFKLGALKKRLAQQGIRWMKAIGEATTHVLVGPKLADLDALQGKALLLERDVQAYLDQAEQPYLQAPQSEEQVAHLRQLLRSEEPDHHRLAVELFKGGGFVEALLLDAIRVLRRTTDPALKKDLEVYLRRYASPESLRRTLDVERPLEDWEDRHLLKLLQAWRNAENKPRQVHALRELVLRYASTDLVQHPLEAGSRLCIQGIMSFKVTELRQRLAALDIELTKDLGDATHVLIGPKLEAIKPLKDRTLLVEQELQRFLDQVEQPYLQQAQSSDQIGNLRQLLLSKNIEDQWVAVSLFEGGGFVDALLVETMVVAKLSSDKKLRKKLGDFIKRYSTPELYKMYTIRKSLDPRSERKLSGSIRKITQHFKTSKKRVDMGLQIARILYEYNGSGLQYLWHRSRDPKEVLDLLKAQLKGEVLDLSSRDFSFVPKAVGQLTHIKELNLNVNHHMGRLPDTIVQLQNLETLHIAATNIYQLELLKELPKLHTLYLGYTYIYAEQIAELTQLKTLHLPKHTDLLLSPKDRAEPTPKRLAKFLRQAIPNLEIIRY